MPPLPILLLLGLVAYAVVRNRSKGASSRSAVEWSWGGLAMMLGGVLSAVTLLLSGAGSEPSSGEGAILHAMGAFAALLLLVGVARYRHASVRRGQISARVGVGLLAIGLAGMAVGFALGSLSLISSPTADGIGFYLVSPAYHLLVPIGLILWGATHAKATTLPSWRRLTPIFMGVPGLAYAPIFCIAFFSGYRFDLDRLPELALMLGSMANQLYVLALSLGWLALGITPQSGNFLPRDLETFKAQQAQLRG